MRSEKEQEKGAKRAKGAKGAKAHMESKERPSSDALN